MMPVLEGIIARRVLLNFRADPAVVQKLVPEPLEVVTHNGAAVVGICLIRLEQLRPKGLTCDIGLASENLAHRVAIRFPTTDGMKDGVFIWRRETDLALITFLGGRLFPGVHRAAKFYVAQDAESLEMEVRTARQEADVWFRASLTRPWTPTATFPTLEDAREFFRRGDCGFSCGLRDDKLEGMQLRTLVWEMTPLAVSKIESAFYSNPTRLPPGSVAFDSALLMRGIPHEWHELHDLPELAGTHER